MKGENEKVGLKLNIQKLRSQHPVPSLHGKQKGKKWKQWQILFSWAQKSVWIGDCNHEIKTLAPWKENYDKPRQCIKKQKQHFADKGPYSQSYGFSSSRVRMWELDHKKS